MAISINSSKEQHVAVRAQKARILNLTFAAISANTIAEQDVTVPGTLADSVVVANKPTDDAGIHLLGVRVKSANTVSFKFWNSTAGALTPAANQNFVLIQL